MNKSLKGLVVGVVLLILLLVLIGAYYQKGNKARDFSETRESQIWVPEDKKTLSFPSQGKIVQISGNEIKLRVTEMQVIGEGMKEVEKTVKVDDDTVYLKGNDSDPLIFLPRLSGLKAGMTIVVYSSEVPTGQVVLTAKRIAVLD
jgi:hypothetical protein